MKTNEKKMNPNVEDQREANMVPEEEAWKSMEN